MKLFKKGIALSLTALLIVTMFTGCKKDGKDNPKTPDNSKTVIATMVVKDYGTITIELYPEKAPKTVENFVKHSKDGYYNGLTFHRVMFDFMIQGGDPNGDGTGGKSIWGGSFEDEFSDLRNFTGAISMANSGPNTNGSQFFIVNSKTSLPKELVNSYRQQQGLEAIDYSASDYKKYEEVGGTPWLDNKHTVFGYVKTGMDVVDKVMQVEVAEGAKPVTPVIIESITIAE